MKKFSENIKLSNYLAINKIKKYRSKYLKSNFRILNLLIINFQNIILDHYQIMNMDEKLNLFDQ